MKISINWIKDFANLPVDLEDRDMAERITLSVCEVEAYERSTGIDDRVRVAEVVKVSPHPNADKLKLATVRLGGEKESVVVCAAPNCRAGIKTPYAPVGVRLPGGIVLESRNIRGVVSEGMLCAEDELDLSDNHDGIMELGSDAVVGAKLTEVPGIGKTSDCVLEIDNKSLTHRPDCWGHYGLAREFATVFKSAFKDKFNADWNRSLKKKIAEDGGTAPVIIQVDRDSANLGFMGLSVDGVTVGNSPDWMRQRLKAAGMRPINTIVDVSNYVMLETGIPNHIFDRRTIYGGRIVVRRAGKNMEFTTLDGQLRRILPTDTMVCDAQRESAIAGIMGGLDSSVTAETTQITIEAANWVDAEIRRTSIRLGLRTDASQRYEKSLDSQQLETCLLRIYELLKELCPDARAVGCIQADNMPEPVDLTVKTSLERVSMVLGTQVEEKRMEDILTALGFRVEKMNADADGLTHLVHVPTWRSTKDIECESDIIEEIGRILGYGNIRPSSPVHPISPRRLSPGKKLFRRAQDFLVLHTRAMEVMTYPLIGLDLLKKAEWPIHNNELVLANGLTLEHDRMRPGLIPSLLKAAAENAKEHENFRIFECGRSYVPQKDKFSNDLYQIGLVFKSVSDNPFIPLEDSVEELLAYLGLACRLQIGSPAEPNPIVPAGWAGSHPHEFVDVRIMGKPNGVVLSIHPQISHAFKIRGRLAMAVLDLTEVMEWEPTGSRVFQALDRFPGSRFDVTVVLPANVYAADAVEVVRKMRIKEMRSAAVLDVFDMQDGNRALTLRMEFRDANRTLSHDFISQTEQEVMATLDKSGFALRV